MGLDLPSLPSASREAFRELDRARLEARRRAWPRPGRATLDDVVDAVTEIRRMRAASQAARRHAPREPRERTGL